MDEILTPGRLTLPHNVAEGLSPDFHLDIPRKSHHQPTSHQHPFDQHLIQAGIHIDKHTHFILAKRVKRIIGVLSDGPRSLILHAELIQSPTLPLGKPPNINDECIIKIRKTSYKALQCRIRKEFYKATWCRGILHVENSPDIEEKIQHRLSKEVKRVSKSEGENFELMEEAHIRVPQVYEVKEHVLFMSFLRNNHTSLAMGKLSATKDLNQTQEDRIYQQTVDMMHSSFQSGGLIHSDISDTNILLDEEDNCWFVDVGMSVKRDHPSALDSLVGVCEQVEKLFTKRGVRNVLPSAELLEHISSLSANKRNSWKL